MNSDSITVLDRAISLAVRAHAGTRRGVDDLPYILHPMEAAVIAATMTNDPEILAAAVLHDTVEDAGVTLREIEDVCGRRVANLVASETETRLPDMDAAQSWQARKSESLSRLAVAEDPGTKIMWLSDKLANVRGYYRYRQRHGEDVWSLFHQTDKKKHEWYYRSILDLLADLRDTDAYREYERLVNTLFGGNRDE